MSTPFTVFLTIFLKLLNNIEARSDKGRALRGRGAGSPSGVFGGRLGEGVCEGFVGGQGTVATHALLLCLSVDVPIGLRWTWPRYGHGCRPDIHSNTFATQHHYRTALHTLHMQNKLALILELEREPPA